MNESPKATSDFGDMHVCAACRQHTPQPEPMSSAEFEECRSVLSPGDVVPSGLCPACESPTFPSRAREEDLAPLGCGRGADPWTARVERAGESFLVALASPDGNGCEIVVDVDGERPRVTVTSWDHPDNVETAEPFLQIRVGSDGAAARSCRRQTAPAVIFEDDRARATAPMSTETWNGITKWLETVPDGEEVEKSQD